MPTTRYSSHEGSVLLVFSLREVSGAGASCRNEFSSSAKRLGFRGRGRNESIVYDHRSSPTGGSDGVPSKPLLEIEASALKSSDMS